MVRKYLGLAWTNKPTAGPTSDRGNPDKQSMEYLAARTVIRIVNRSNTTCQDLPDASGHIVWATTGRITDGRDELRERE
jgi:hypothetical protein